MNFADAAIPPAIRAEIERRLAAITAEENVRLLLAVESGSRAWGFPSPDSDYDVRFVYVRPRRDYLALSPPRDVIERPIVDEIDCNGWDTRKALGLLLKHNAVLSEWLESPLRYVPDDPAVMRLADLATRHFDPRGYALHYASLGRGAVARWFAGEEGMEVPVKRYFYALRPALMVRALRLDPSHRPPMSMAPLLDAAQVDGEVRHAVAELITLKAQTNEAGNVARLPVLDRLITKELGRAGEVAPRAHDPAFAAEADALFLELVEGA